MQPPADIFAVPLPVRQWVIGKDTIMEKLSAAVGSQLCFVQPKALERQFELRTAKSLFGVISFETALGTRATAEVATGRWTFKRVGFLNPRVTIREAGSDADVGVFWPKFSGGGWLEFSHGGRFQWKSLNFWASTWGFANPGGELVFTLKPGAEKFKLSDLFRTQAVVEIGTASFGLAELSLLLMLGWYLMIMQQDDAAATVVTTTAC